MFEYNPADDSGLRPGHRWGQQLNSNDIRTSATNALVSVREEFEGHGGGNRSNKPRC